jgi:ABC-type Fe3+/spermidine/putrescine transport system ATPase subunit
VTGGAGLRCRGLVAAPGGTVVLRGANLEVPAGTLTVLVGPSGAGKTTLLRVVAGLTPLDGGAVELGGRDLAGVPPHRRRVGLVFQEPRLFPNLDVADNVAFALRVAGVGRQRRRERAAAVLDEVGLAGFAARPTAGLSGGERQRVALARALAMQPELLLLDEPLAAVDPERREELRRLVRGVQRERSITTVYVTHDRAEAAELGDRVALMLDGLIVQHDRPAALFERPSTALVARFFGSPNLLAGMVAAGRLWLGGAWIGVPGPDGDAMFTIRPERVELDQTGPLRLRVEQAAYAGSHVRLLLGAGELELEAHVPVGAAPAVGADARVALPREHLWRFPDPPAAGAAPAGTGSDPARPARRERADREEARPR